MDISQSNWNESDDSNTAAAPDGAPEGMAPSGVNNLLRAHQGAVKRWYNQTIPLLTGGSSTAYTLSYGVAPTALADGQTHLVQFNADCGASPTLNVNILGAKPIHYWSGAAWAVVPTGMIKNGMVARVTYNSSAGTYRISSASAPVVAQSIGATTGYTTLPGATPVGMQWGTVVVTGGSNAGVAFPVAFSGGPYTIQITANGNNGATTGQSHVANATVSGFTLFNKTDSGINFLWMAIGAA